MRSGMKLAAKIRKQLGISSIYGFWKFLVLNGAEITRNGVEKLEKHVKGGSFETLCVLRKVSGMSWNEFGEELDREFLPKNKK